MNVLMVEDCSIWPHALICRGSLSIPLFSPALEGKQVAPWLRASDEQ